MARNCTCLETWQKTMLLDGHDVGVKKITYARKDDGELIYGVNIPNRDKNIFLRFTYCPICGTKFKGEL